MGPGGFFPTNPDLADILGRTDLDFETCHVFYVLDPKLLDFQIRRFPKIRSRSGFDSLSAKATCEDLLPSTMACIQGE